MRRKTHYYLLLVCAFFLFFLVIQLHSYEISGYTLSDLLIHDELNTLDGFIDDSFKYQLSLDESSWIQSKLNFFHGGMGLVAYTFPFSSVAHWAGWTNTKLYFLPINILLVWRLISFFPSSKGLTLFCLLPYLVYLTATLNKELYTITFLAYLVRYDLNLEAKTIGNSKLSIKQFKSIDLVLILNVFLFAFLFICTLLSRPLLLGIYIMLRFFLLSLSGVNLKQFTFSRSAFNGICFLLILLCSLYLFVSSSDLTQLFFSWITFDASAQSKSISEMPLYYRLFGAFYFLIAPVLSPLQFIFNDKQFFGYLQGYMFFAYICMAPLILPRIKYFLGWILSGLHSFNFRRSKLHLYPSVIILLFATCILIGFRAEQITRQLLVIIIPMSFAIDESLEKFHDYK